MVFLGLLYANGQGVAKDYAKAREWFEKAADKGNAGAMSAAGGSRHKLENSRFSF